MRRWWVPFLVLVLAGARTSRSAPAAAPEGAIAAPGPWAGVLGVAPSRFTGGAATVYDEWAWALVGGTALRVPLAHGALLRTGLEVVRRGGGRTGALATITTDWGGGFVISDSLGRVQRKWAATWLDVPLWLEYRFGAGRVRPYVTAGPGLSVRVAGTGAGAYLPAASHARPLDLRAAAGVGVAIRDGSSLLAVELVGSAATRDLFARGEGPSGRTQTVSLRLTLTP